MKSLKFIFVTGFVLALFCSMFSQTDAQSPMYIRVDYMKVAPGNSGAYVDLESTVWKKIHEERIKAGIITGWSLYSVMFPNGSKAEYTHVTVNTYDDFNKLQGEYPDSIFSKAMMRVPESKRDSLGPKTMSARELVRTDIFVIRDFIPPNPGAKYLHVNYMKTVPGKNYLQNAREAWKPIQQTRKDMGALSGWGVYGLMYPGGAELAYNFGTVDFYDNFADLNNGLSDEIMTKAHPNMDQDARQAMMSRSSESRSLVRRQLWVMLDQVLASAP